MSFDADDDNRILPSIFEDGFDDDSALVVRQHLPASRPRPPRRQRRDALSGMLAGLVIFATLVLVGLALLLPPFSLGKRLVGSQYAALTAQTPSVSLDGLTVSIDPTAASTFSVRLHSMTITNAKIDDTNWIRLARAALPTTADLITPVYQIDKQGAAGATLSVTVTIPTGIDATKVDLLTYNSQVPGDHWQFLPAHPSANATALIAIVKTLPDTIGLFLSKRSVPLISVVIEPGQHLTPALTQVANVIQPAGLQPNSTGALQGVLPAGIDIGRNYVVIPVIRNFSASTPDDSVTVTRLIAGDALETAHITQLVDFVLSKPYAGLGIDYRGLAADQRDHFSAFIELLAQNLHRANLTLTVVVPFPTQGAKDFDTGAYDWRTLSNFADNIQMLLPLDPQSFTDHGVVTDALHWAIGEINRTQLQISVNTLSLRQNNSQNKTDFTPISYHEALAGLGQITLKPSALITQGQTVEGMLSGNSGGAVPVPLQAQFKALNGADMPSIQYFEADGSLRNTMWLATAPIIRHRIDQSAEYNFAGAVMLDLADPGVVSSVIDALFAFKVSQPGTAQINPLALRWTVLLQGKVVAEATSAPGTPFPYKPDTTGNDFQIGVEILGAQSTLSPVPLSVIPATSLPTLSGAKPPS